MRRFILVAVVTAGALAVWAFPAPDVESGAGNELPDPRPLSSRSNVWYCSGSDAETDPVLGAALPTAGRAEFSLPADGEFLDVFEERLTDPGVAEVDVGDGLRFHPGPALIEVSSSPSGAAVVLSGPSQLAGDSCQTAAKEWFLNAGTQGPVETLTLRLFNPLLEPARVSLQLMSEFGFEPLLDDARVLVGPRDWEDFDFGPLLGERDRVAIKVSAVEGVVIPSFSSVGPEGLAVWPGEGLSPHWEFPVAQAEATSGIISLWNPGVVDATASVSIIGTAGVVGNITVTVGAQREERIDLSTVSDAEVGAVVTSDIPLAAAVLVKGPGGRAGSTAAPRPVERWLVPANNLVGGLDYRVIVLNSSGDDVELLSRPIGSETANRVVLPAGTIRRLAIAGKGAELTASGPVTVAWIVVGSSDLGIGLANPVVEVVP